MILVTLRQSLMHDTEEAIRAHGVERKQSDRPAAMRLKAAAKAKTVASVVDVLTYLCLAFFKVGETGLWKWLYGCLEKLDLLAVLEDDFDWARVEGGFHLNAAGDRMLMAAKSPPASASAKAAEFQMEAKNNREMKRYKAETKLLWVYHQYADTTAGTHAELTALETHRTKLTAIADTALRIGEASKAAAPAIAVGGAPEDVNGAPMDLQ